MSNDKIISLKEKHAKLLERQGIIPEEISADKAIADIELICELEEVQGFLDDTITVLTQQIETVEAVITKIIKNRIEI